MDASWFQNKNISGVPKIVCIHGKYIESGNKLRINIDNVIVVERASHHERKLNELISLYFQAQVLLCVDFSMASSPIIYTAILPESEEIHIEDIIINIPKEIKPALHESCCIYKVPPNLRKLNNGESYTPQLISIGPFHHTNEELKPMHTQKQRYFHAFWKRVTNKKSLVEYKNFLKDKEKIEKIKNSYSEFDVRINDDQFVDMIMLDSVFILELFLRKSKESDRDKDYMFTTSWICKSIQRDLLLLENQLPIFVLKQLYKEIFKDSNDLRLLELAFNYFEDYNPQRSNTHQNEEILKNCKSCKHFTDLIRFFYLPKEVQNGFTKEVKYCVLKTATKLNEASISFVKVHQRSLLDIKFVKVQILNWFLCFGCSPFLKCFKSKLEIPQFKVDQTTECVLRNLIALEQCHYSEKPFICNYVFLIDSLINTQEDVEILVDKEIIVHELGSHAELATMINGLCKNVVVTCNYYRETSQNLNDHYHNRWKRYMGMLRSVYFRDPWRFSSVVVGVVIFLVAILNFLRITGLYFRNSRH